VNAASLSLFLRSLLWTFLLPGLTGFYLPWRYFGLREARLDSLDAAQLLGLAFMIVGAALLATCIFEFARSGRGTLSPVDPPRHLVVRGLYRYVRNPMYLSVTTIILGETLVARTQDMAVYLAVWFLCVNLFVLFVEEPELRRQFGASYEDYCRRVHRWIPRTERSS
jgi:protein-S-isoprenylcysteine O-methyltransferase Ste14